MYRTLAIVLISKPSSAVSMNIVRQNGTKTKVKGILQEEILTAVESKELNPKRHPGIVKPENIGIPKALHAAILKILKDTPLQPLNEEGEQLNRYLKGRHAPVPREIMKKIPRNQVYNWKPIDYDARTCLQYLVGRIEPDIAILNRVFAEITTRLPEFQPKSLFDFGSGVGSVIWSGLAAWRKSIKEIYCVDASGDMNNLAELLLKGGDPDANFPIPGTYFRQFLPASHRDYDIIVSAFSLFELESTEVRLKTLFNLWNKTNNFLVLIEQGTNAGFKLIDEAKEFILYLAKKEDNAHIFAPCPHEEVCPRMQIQDGTPCNFEVRYPSPLKGSQSYLSERFCYVIIAKGKRPESSVPWPRVVRPTLVRKKHTICRLCTSSAKLQEIIFTAAKNGTATYKCARYSRWGDLLPIDIKELEHNEKEFAIKELKHNEKESETGKEVTENSIDNRESS